MNLDEFISQNKEIALSIDLNEYKLINNALQTQKNKLNNSEFESEFIEVKEFCEKAIKEIKFKLLTCLQSNNNKITYIGLVAPYILDVRMIIEYRALLNEAINLPEYKKNSIKQNETISSFINSYDAKLYSELGLTDLKSDNYYGEILINYRKELKNSLPENNIYKKELDLYNHYLYSIVRFVYQIYNKINKFSVTDVNEKDKIYLALRNYIFITMHDLQVSIRGTDYSLFIKKLLLKEDYKNAIIVRDYCLLKLESLNRYVLNNYLIQVDRTCLKNDINKVIENLKASINVNEINIKKAYQNQEPQQNTINDKINIKHVAQKKIPEKFYALYHWILIELGKEKAFEKNAVTNKYDKEEIINFGKERYQLKTQGQLFYDNYINTDISNKTAISRSFGKGYKDILIEISNNNADIISHLKKYPN